MAEIELTSTVLLAAATEELEASGFARVPDSLVNAGQHELRVFEDDLSLVGIAVYDAWRELMASWEESQEALVSLISNHAGQANPKAWDAYLILLCSNPIPEDNRAQQDEIQYNTSRVRKIVATADVIETVGDVRTALLPVLRLSEQESGEALPHELDEVLLELLEQEYKINKGVMQLLLKSFAERRPLLEGLREHLKQS